MNVRFLALSMSLLAAAAPAAAAERRAGLSVTVQVVSTCTVTASGPAATCSHPVQFEVTTHMQPDERPVAEAALLLGAPERRGSAVQFDAPALPLSAEVEAANIVRFHTISY